MKAMHRGYQITGMAGTIQAEISEEGEYVQIVLSRLGDQRSFDQAGLHSFIEDLGELQELASIVRMQNRTDNQVPE